MTKEQKSILFGSMLGDGYIQRTGNGNGIFRVTHTYKDKDYLLWKYGMLKDICLKEPTIRVRPRWGKLHKSIRFHTRALPYLTHLHKTFYKDGKRILNQRILSKLDELALAVWYMDDGCTSIRKEQGSRTLYLCLQRYTEKERDLVIDYFKRKWNIDGWRKEKSGNIAIGSYKGEKFLQLIKPYIIPCMERKIQVHPNTRIAIKKQ